MDDTKKIKITLGGEEYAFAPLTEGQLTALMLSQKGGRMVLSTFGRILQKSCGEDVWEDIVGRVLDDEITLKDLGEALTEIAKGSGAE